MFICTIATFAVELSETLTAFMQLIFYMSQVFRAVVHSIFFYFIIKNKLYFKF